jgi:hypothetical protein
MENRLALIGAELQYGANGRIVRSVPLGTDGDPTTWLGIAAVLTEYDARDLAVRHTKLDSQNQPLVVKEGHWTIHEIARNGLGEITADKYIRVDAKGGQSTLSETLYSYDEFGHPSDIRFNGPVSWHSAFKYDIDGNLNEESFLDANGKLTTNESGYAIKRSKRSLSNNGMRMEESYFDTKGEKSYQKAGYHRLITEFDPGGMVSRMIQDEHGPQKYKYYRYISEPVFDGQGRMRQHATRYENQDGSAPKDTGLPYTKEEAMYDEKGRETAAWQFGWPESEGATVWKKDTEWYDSDDTRTIAWQAYDEQRQKLTKLTNLNPAYYIDEYSRTGSLTRKYQSNYDESRLGFFSREIMLNDGKLERITYRRSDGSEIKEMRTLVHEILPDAQPIVKEKLRTGDQLVSANGAPIKSAFIWTFGSDFTGGWIEVWRNGETIRIDGIEGGTLGVYLVDRGPGATDYPQPK